MDDRDNDGMPIAELVDERQCLLEVACRLLGGSTGADRVVNEAYRRWYELPGPARAAIAVPRTWLVKVTGALCPARPGLPGGKESGLDDDFGTPPDGVVRIVGQRRPERADPAGPARRSRRAQRSRPTPPRLQDVVARSVLRACMAEDAALLTSLLTSDAAVFFDGGGKVRAPADPVHGDRRVARSLLALLAPHPRTTVCVHAVNGRTGLVVRYGGQVAAVVGLDVAGPHVVQVWVTLNPDKLRPWNRPDPPTGP
ncbi:RNA polymerase subunit sigma [Streptomyces sp. NPDC085927]|uniref:RNA polymerase subunit sigma n=1 Tax=Streptomyces sp. NPDC085927 TaxID=3365738 RepID=UPI0037D01EB0